MDNWNNEWCGQPNLFSLPFGDGLLPHYKDPLNYRGWYFAFRGSLKKKHQISNIPKHCGVEAPPRWPKPKAHKQNFSRLAYIYICIITIMINNNYRFKKIKHEYTQLQFLPSKIKQGSPALSRSRHWSGSHVAWWPGSGSFFCTSEGKLKNRGSTRNSIDIYIMYILYIYTVYFWIIYNIIYLDIFRCIYIYLNEQ